MSRGGNLGKRSQWLDRLRRFGRSNLSVTEFCRREKVSVPSYYHWRRKLADTAFEHESNGEPATFLPVRIAGSAGLEASLPNGARVILSGLDRQLVRVIIESIAMAPTRRGDA